MDIIWSIIAVNTNFQNCHEISSTFAVSTLVVDVIVLKFSYSAKCPRVPKCYVYENSGNCYTKPLDWVQPQWNTSDAEMQFWECLYRSLLCNAQGNACTFFGESLERLRECSFCLLLDRKHLNLQGCYILCIRSSDHAVIEVWHGSIRPWAYKLLRGKL